MTGLIRCFSTLGCPRLSVRQAAALAVAHLIPAIELRVISGSLDVPAALAAEFGSPAGLAAWLKGATIRILGMGTSQRLFGDRFDIDELDAFVPWAEAAGTPYLRIFDGGNRLSDSDYRQAADRLGVWQFRRQKQGLKVDLMIETHDALYRPDQLAAFVELLPEAKILWDTHHTWAKGGSDPLETWRSIAPSVVHLHVKDSIGAAGGRRYVLPGQGEFPMPTLLAELHKDTRGLPMSLEWEKHWHDELPQLDDAFFATRGWW